MYKQQCDINRRIRNISLLVLAYVVPPKNFMRSPSVQPPLPLMSRMKAGFDTSFKQLGCPVRSTISTKPSRLGISFPFVY